MKKTLSILISLMLILSLGTIVFAAELPAQFTLQWKKNGTEATISNNVTCSVEADPENPSGSPVISVSRSDGNTDTFVISHPSFIGAPAGVYHYTIRQDPASETIQGVAYDADPIEYYILVDNSGNILENGIGSEEGPKKATFTNNYETKSLTITGVTEGNISDTTKTFPLTVTLTSESGSKVFMLEINYTRINGQEGHFNIGYAGSSNTSQNFEIKHQGSILLPNIPVGTTVTIEETDNFGYTTSWSVDGAASTQGNSCVVSIGAEGDHTVSITNNLNASISTGINLDTLPYLILLGIAALGSMLLIRKRKKNSEEA